MGLEAQKQIVEGYAERTGQKILSFYTEVESGRCKTRPELERALAHVRAARAKLVVAKLDRLARDAVFLLGLVDSDVPVIFCDLPEVCTGDPIVGRLTLTVLAAIAEFEGRRIGQRIKEAAAVRRERGDPMGWMCTKAKRNPLTGQQQRKGTVAARAVNQKKFLAFREMVRPVALGLKSEGRSYSEVAEEMNKRGYKTRRGNPWTLQAVFQLVS